MNSGFDAEYPWDELALAPTGDVAEIQRAYARRLKTIDLATEREAFQVLRRAYEAALIAAADETAPTPVATLDERPVTAPPLPAPSAPIDEWGWAHLRAVLDEFAAPGRAGDISGAMAALDRLDATRLSIERQATLEARLFRLVMDDPDMPVELLARLAERLRWREIGSALELYHPDLYARFLYRVSHADEWLRQLRELRASGPRQGWLQRTRLLGLGSETPSYAAYLVLEPYDWRFARFGVGPYDEETLDQLLRQARRFGPLLGDAVDPRMVEFLWRHRKRLAVHKSIVRKIVAAMISIVVVAVGLAYYADHTGLIVRWGPAAKPPDAMQVLNTTPETWIGLDRRGGDMLIYFTGLMGAHGAIAEIRYGIDTPTPDRAFAFPPTDDPWPASLPADFLPYVAAPADTRYVSLQLRFKDGTLSPIRRFAAPAPQ